MHIYSKKALQKYIKQSPESEQLEFFYQGTKIILRPEGRKKFLTRLNRPVKAGMPKPTSSTSITKGALMAIRLYGSQLNAVEKIKSHYHTVEGKELEYAEKVVAYLEGMKIYASNVRVTGSKHSRREGKRHRLSFSIYDAALLTAGGMGIQNQWYRPPICSDRRMEGLCGKRMENSCMLSRAEVIAFRDKGWKVVLL